MNNVAIKVCGITQPQDVVALGEQGIEYMGFIFVEGSKRQLTERSCLGLLNHVPKATKSVAVFMNQSLTFIQSILKEFPVDIVQLHGEQDGDLVKLLDRPVVQRLHPFTWLQRSQCTEHSNLKAHLLDAGAGHGETFDWGTHLHTGVEINLSKAWLAGGLSPANVSEHVRLLHPAVVDVCSGVEADGKPGHKSIEKVISFIKEVRGATNGSPK